MMPIHSQVQYRKFTNIRNDIFGDWFCLFDCSRILHHFQCPFSGKMLLAVLLNEEWAGRGIDKTAHKNFTSGNWHYLCIYYSIFDLPQLYFCTITENHILRATKTVHIQVMKHKMLTYNLRLLIPVMFNISATLCFPRKQPDYLIRPQIFPVKEIAC